MMSFLFTALIAAALIVGGVTGHMEAVSAAALGESAKAVELVLGLMGGLCLWSGVMNVARAAGLTEKLAKLLSPITRRLFRTLDPHGKAMEAISLNLTASLLGLGNAVTPLGIAAMEALEREEHPGQRASDNMVLFVVLNTASLQLVPATTALLRLQAGSTAPMEILLPVWITSMASVCVAVLAAKALGRHSIPTKGRGQP